MNNIYTKLMEDLINGKIEIIQKPSEEKNLIFKILETGKIFELTKENFVFEVKEEELEEKLNEEVKTLAEQNEEGVEKDMEYLLNMTKEEFNSKVLCEGISTIKTAAKVLGIDIENQERWEATKNLYEGWLKLKNNK